MNKGGLGLLNFQLIHSIAHIASVFGLPFFSDMFKRRYIAQQEEGITNLESVYGPFGLQLVQRLEGFKTYLDLNANASTMDVFKKLDSIRQKAAKKKTTMQRWLYGLQDKQQVRGLHQDLKEDDPTLREYFNWRQIANQSASMWLMTQCTRKEFLMDNKEFSAALCLRYHLDIPFLDTTNDGIRSDCPCCKHKNCVDSKGFHLITCKTDAKTKNGFRQGHQIHAVHDQLCYTLYRITKHANSRSLMEPEGWLYKPDTNEHVVPDLQVKLSSTTQYPSTRTFAVDLSLACPFKGSESGNIAIPAEPKDHEKITGNEIHKLALIRKKTKIAKYGPACGTHTTFVPFIITTTGKIHSDGYKFLELLADHAAETRNELDSTPFFHYYLKLMSVELMKLNAKLLYCKSVAVFSRNIQNPVDHLRKGNLAVYNEWNAHPSSRFT